MTATDGPALRTVVRARVAADAGGAVLFGLLLPDGRSRLKIAGFAALWALLCAWSVRHIKA